MIPNFDFAMQIIQVVGVVGILLLLGAGIVVLEIIFNDKDRI